MDKLPFRRRVPFKPFVSAPVNPAIVSGSNPAPPRVTPDEIMDEKLNVTEIIDPVASGSLTHAPDGWITRTVAQERLSLAGIELDSRRIRHLCARNELESVKVKNEKNQPQYFIKPQSLDQYITENKDKIVDKVIRMINPAPPHFSPDTQTPKDQEYVGKPDEDVSGKNTHAPDEVGEGVKDVEIRLLKDQLGKTEQIVEYLQGELVHRRTTDKALTDVIEAFRLNAATSTTAAKLSANNQPPYPPQ